MLRGVALLMILCQGLMAMSQEVILEEEEEVEIVNDNGQLSVDYGLMIEDLASEHQVIMAHAQDVDSFMTSVWGAVENGQDTVNIPAEIDPDEPSIGFEDAIDKIDDMCEIDMTMAQQFLEKVNDIIAQMENGTMAYKIFIDMRKDIESAIEIFTNVKRKAMEQKQSLEINQLYEYLYVDEEENPLTKSTQQDFNIIPYGNDAHHDDDDDEEEEDMTSNGVTPDSLIQDQNAWPEALTRRNPTNTDGKTEHFRPIFTIASIVLTIVAFILIAAVISCVCVIQKRKQAKSSTPSLAEETKKEPISIVTIPVNCHQPVPHTNSQQNDLPCYLDVICDKMSH